MGRVFITAAVFVLGGVLFGLPDAMAQSSLVTVSPQTPRGTTTC